MKNKLSFLTLILVSALTGLVLGCGGGCRDCGTTGTSGSSGTTGGSGGSGTGSNLPTTAQIQWSSASSGNNSPFLTAGATYTFTTQGREPNAGATISGYEWVFDDGTLPQQVPPPASGGTPSIQHAFSGAGQYNVQVRAFDSFQLTGPYTGVQVTVTAPGDVPPVTLPPTETSAGSLLIPGQSYSFTSTASWAAPAIATAAAPASGNGIIDYFWDWGDGSPVEMTQGNQASHDWLQAGVYGVRAWAEDTLGGIGQPSAADTVTIASPCQDITADPVDHQVLPVGLDPTVAAPATQATLAFQVAPAVAGTISTLNDFTVNPGDPLGGPVASSVTYDTNTGAGTVVVSYPAAPAPGNRVAQPSVAVHDDGDTWACGVTFQPLEIQTVPVAPTLTLTATSQDASGNPTNAALLFSTNTNIYGIQAGFLTATADSVNVTFTASTNQDSSTPVLYTWEFPGQPPLAAGASVGSTQSFPFGFGLTGDQVATYVVTVTADNQKGGVTQGSFLVTVTATS